MDKFSLARFRKQNLHASNKLSKGRIQLLSPTLGTWLGLQDTRFFKPYSIVSNTIYNNDKVPVNTENKEEKTNLLANYIKMEEF